MEVSKPKITRIIHKFLKKKKNRPKMKTKGIKKKKKEKKYFKNDRHGKPKQCHEGMFLKGIRTQYINRELLNEANEARKNEDINKIIDIGKVWDEKEWKLGKSFKKNVASTFKTSNENSTPVCNYEWKLKRESYKPKREMQSKYLEEFKRFFFLYDEKFGYEIRKLPKNGVLETALKSLKNINNEKDFLQENNNDKLFLNKRESKNESCILSSSARKYFSFEHLNFQQNTFENQTNTFIFPSDIEVENIDIEAFSPFLQQDSPQLLPKFTKDSEKLAEEIIFDSLHTQFYRRNMF